MNPILKQRNFLLTKEFEITDRSVKIISSKPFNYLEEEYTFDQFTANTKRVKNPNFKAAILLIIGIFMLIVFALNHWLNPEDTGLTEVLVCLLAVIILLLINYFAYENKINFMFNGWQGLSFYANSPDKATVDAFITVLKQEQKKFLLAKYVTDNEYLTDEQLSNNLNWLWNKAIIDTSELEELKKAMLTKADNERQIGFFAKPSSN